MFNILKEKIEQSVQDQYGSKCPALIKERVQTELKMAELHEMASTLLVLQKLTKEFQEKNVQYCVEGTCVNSILLYLLGITFTNPLPVHYYCPNCKKVEFTDVVKDGFDLKKKVCTCGETMEGDGHNLVPMLFWCNSFTSQQNKYHRDHGGRIIFLKVYEMGLFELEIETMKLLDEILHFKGNKRKWKIDLQWICGKDLRKYENIYRPLSSREIKRSVVKSTLEKIDVSEELKEFFKNEGQLCVTSMERYLWWQGVDRLEDKKIWKRLKTFLASKEVYTWPTFYDDLYGLFIKKESQKQTMKLLDMYYRDRAAPREDPVEYGYASASRESYKELSKYLPKSMQGDECFRILFSRGSQIECSILQARLNRGEKEREETKKKNRYFTIDLTTFDSTYTLELVNKVLEDNYVAVGPIKNVVGLRKNLAELKEKYVLVATEGGVIFLLKTKKPGNKKLLENGIRGCHIPQNWISAGYLTNMGEILVGRTYYVKVGHKKVIII